MRLLIAALLLTGCASVPVSSFSDSLGLAYLSVDTLAVTTHEACRNEAPGGNCAPDAPLSTETKEDIRYVLSSALGVLDEARHLYALGAYDAAQTHLHRARTLLRGVEQTLARLEQ